MQDMFTYLELPTWIMYVINVASANSYIYNYRPHTSMEWGILHTFVAYYIYAATSTLNGEFLMDDVMTCRGMPIKVNTLQLHD